jgi:hypothetical protein
MAETEGARGAGIIGSDLQKMADHKAFPNSQRFITNLGPGFALTMKPLRQHA